MYLKAVGLIVFMTHVGSFVPAKKCVIGVCDRLLTRIATLESNVTPQSAFTLDLSQMSRLLKSHTPCSLCLCDEFGKGTSPVDALSLLTSTIEHFCQPEHKCRCLFALHYTEVLSPGLVSQQALKHILTFRMGTHPVPAEGEREHAALDEEVEPMFLLEVGISPSSYGLQCARAAGVAPALVDRATEVRECLSGRKAIHPLPSLSSEADAQASINSEASRRVLRKFFQVRDWTDEAEATETVLSELMALCQQALQERCR